MKQSSSKSNFFQSLLSIWRSSFFKSSAATEVSSHSGFCRWSKRIDKRIDEPEV